MSDLGNKEIFANNLKYYLKLYDIDRNKVCDSLSIPYSTFADWINAKKYPRIDKIEILANYFGIEKSDLIEDKNKNIQNTRQVLFDKTKDLLSDDDWATIEFIMNKTIANYEKNKNNME
ncbi:MAG: helix-turn-helix domain-containing protein [Bacilli bacterium]